MKEIKSKREEVIQNLKILALVLVSILMIRELFSSQLSSLMNAANTILVPAAIALFISYLLAPIVKLLEEKAKIKPRWLNILIVFFVVFIVGSIFMYFIGRIIYDQAVGFLDQDWDQIVSVVENFIKKNEIFLSISENVNKFFDIEVLPPILLNVLNVFKSAISFLITIVLVPVFLFFLLNEKKKIFKGLISLLPIKWQGHAKNLGIRGNNVIEKYFNGRFISMFIMSVFYTIIFLALGLRERSVFFGFTLGFLDIIPYIGPTIGVILPLLYSFAVKDTTLFKEFTPLVILIANFVGQFIQGNILQPVIMGREVDLHPLLVLSSFLFFGTLFGVVGIILAIPITGMLKSTLEYIREINAIENKDEKFVEGN